MTIYDPYRVSRPTVFLGLMLVFLILSAFVILILMPQLKSAFFTNPGLNGMIIGVLLIGIVLSLWQVIRLIPEARWVNDFRISDEQFRIQNAPRLLSPMAAMLRDQSSKQSLSTQASRTILDSIGMRLDEMREISRYLIGLLVFLGLLGTFWGLTQTVSSISSVINALEVGSGELAVVFDNLKQGLNEPLQGMGTAFSSSLFGLAGSLILGFMDLQASQAQNRFYTELEDWLSTITNVHDKNTNIDISHTLHAIEQTLARLTISLEHQAQSTQHALPKTHVQQDSITHLAEGVQALVQHMRSEQQQIRNWVEAQASKHDKLAQALEKIAPSLKKGD